MRSMHVQIAVADGGGLFGNDRLVHGAQATVFYGNAAVDDGVVHRRAQADRAKDVFHVISCADELQTAAVDQEKRVLISETMTCSARLHSEYRLDYEGVVQLNFTDADGIEEGWVRMLRAE